MARRFVISLVIFFAIAAGVAYALRDTIATAVGGRLMDRLEEAAASRGVVFEEVEFSKASFVGLWSIAFLDVRGTVVEGHKLIHGTTGQLSFEIDRVVFSAVSFWPGRVLAAVEDGKVAILSGDGTPTGERIYGVRAEVELFVNWLHPVESAVALETELRRLLREGRWNLAARVSGEVRFEVGEMWHDMTVRSLSESGEMRLLLEREDVEALSRNYRIALTEAEIDLVVENPVLAPDMMHLSELANKTSVAYMRRDRKFPYDAFRHVYWSWLLTREFGPIFAEKVTDAHEIGATYEFGERNRLMDLRNNAVGRAYALAGVRESELEERVLTDENVMRSPGDVEIRE